MKKILALVLCFVLVVSLTGCSLFKREKILNGGIADGVNDIGGNTSDLVESDDNNQEITSSNVTDSSMTASTPTASTPTATKKQFEPVTNPRELVEMYDRYCFWEFCCEYEDVELSQVEKYFTNEQKEFVCSVVKSKCCKTKEEALAHVAHYMGKVPSKEEFMSYNALELSDGLYNLMGGKGGCFHDYDSMIVTNLPNGDVKITADCLDSGGGYMEKSIFTIKKKNGSYYIYSVEITD